MPRDNLLARFVTMNLLGQGGGLVIGFITSILLARLLGPSSRGLLGLMLSANTLVVVVAAIGLPTAVTYFASLPDADPPAILGNCLVHAATLGAVLIPVSWLFHPEIADALSHGAGGRAWIIVAALAVLTFLDWTTNSQLQGTMRFARYNVVVVLAKVVYAIGVLVLLEVLGLGVTGGLIATGVGALVMILASLKPIIDRGRPRIDYPLMKRMLTYGVRAEVGAILQLAYGRLDVFILQLYRPLSQVGYYIVAQTIAELVLTIAQEFRWTSMVLVTKYEGRIEQSATSADALRHYGILGTLAAFANLFFGTGVILIAYGHSYEPAVLPMLVLMPGIWFVGLGIVIQGDLSGRGRPGRASALAGTAAAVTTGLDFVFIPQLGAVGAALASVCGYSVFGVVSLLALRRVTGIPIRAMIQPTRADVRGYWRFFVDLIMRLRKAG